MDGFVEQPQVSSDTSTVYNDKTGPRFYANSIEHLLEELERIDLLIQAQIQIAREIQQVDSAFQGLYISEQEIDSLLARPAGLPHWASVAFAEDSDMFKDRYEQLTAILRQRVAESTKRGVVLRLGQLRKLFRLTQRDIDILLICLAPELDLRYQRLYAYLQDDITKKYPSVDLVLNLTSRSYAEKIAGRRLFEPRAALIVNRLIRPLQDPSHQVPPLLSHYLKLERRVVDYLLDSDEFSHELLPFVNERSPDETIEGLVLPEKTETQLDALADSLAMSGDGLIMYFLGGQGSGRQTLARALSRRLGVQLLAVDGARFLEARDLAFDELVAILGRELALRQAACYFGGFDALLSRDRAFERQTLLAAMAEWQGPVFLGGERPWQPDGEVLKTAFVQFEVPSPNHAQQVTLWRRALDTPLPVGEDEILNLPSAFRLRPGQIRDAVSTARGLALLREPAAPMPNFRDLRRACRIHSNQKLAELAEKVVPRYQWSDIVIPDNEFAQLREIQNTVKYRHTVYQQWGFDRKLSLGKGLNVLFSGPSGTGKTMAAEVIAKTLGVDLYKIDLSLVVSKYIGETEKNLSRIFDEAETSNAILFFDEADALFGRRSQVRDSHDRYANIETGYLLQRMETYEGVAILATNLPNNLDDAFSRRMAFAVGFPFPDEPHRLRIWKSIWPEQTPLADDLDLAFMAKQFRLAGGKIKNIALAAAFLAADDGYSVGMKHVIRATRREFEKIGKVCVESEFGPYYPLIASRQNVNASKPGARRT